MSGSLWLERGFLEPLWRFPQTTTFFGGLHESQVAGAIAHVRDAHDKLGLADIECLHFFRIVVVPSEPDLQGRLLPARLFISAVYDGSLTEFIRRLVQHGGACLLQVLSFCEGFQPDSRPAEVHDWLMRHAESPQTLHVGTMWDELPVIRDEHRLHVAIADYVDATHALHAWTNGDIRAIRRHIQEFVRGQRHLPQQPRPWRSAWRLFAEWLDKLQTLAALVAPSAVLACLYVWWFAMNWWHLLWLVPAIAVVLVAAYMLVVRYHEIVEGDLVVPLDLQRVKTLVQDEDHGIQNQFTMLTPVRDSFFRRMNLRFILWLANSISKHWYRQGKLVGIDTIHFARFHLIDGGRRMLFMSDFDGGWERYLFDFLGVGSFAVVPIWTNLNGCPKTRFLRFPTRGFAQRFLSFTRANQRQTHLWYSAVDHLTVSEIKRNAQLRAGLFGRLGLKATRKWLKLI